MASVRLYDGETGEALGDAADGALEPVVTAEDYAKVTFALDPAAGRAIVQFVVDPGERRLVAALDLDEVDELPDLYRAVQARVAESEFRMAPPGSAPPHLNVFHYLARQDPLVPDVEIRAHIVSTDEPIQVGVPTASEATSVVAFFRERAPWKTLAVQAVGGSASTADADVVVTVDPRYDDLTWVSRDESWVDEDAVPDDISVEADDDEEETTRSVPDFSPDATGVGTQPEDAPSVLRVFDGDSGELLYDAKDTAETPEAASETAQQRYAEGQAIVVDHDGGEVRARLAARRAAMDRGFYVEYNHPSDDPLLGSFVEELSLRVDDLGVEFAVDVAGDLLDYDRLARVALDRPESLSDAELSALGGPGDRIDIAAPDGETAFDLAMFLRTQVGGNPSFAVSASGRTADLADVDVVVIVDPDADGIEARGATADRLDAGRFKHTVDEVRGELETVVGRIEGFTGTVEARQRVLAAALSGDALASRGLTVAPVDDDPLYRRRKQARYLALYSIVLAGVALGMDAGLFAPLEGLLDATYTVDATGLADSPVPGLAGTYDVPGRTVIAACLGAMLLGAYWLFGHPRGPLGATRTLAKMVRKQVTGGAGSGTVPNTVREVSDPLQDRFDELHEGYRELQANEGSIAAEADSFPAFLESALLSGRDVPDVRVVDHGDRYRQLLVGIVIGAVVGTVAALATLAALWYVTSVAERDPRMVFDGLVAAVGLTLLASLLKAVVIRLGGTWPPRWPMAR